MGASGEPFQKSLLLTYNIEDCKALAVVASRISELDASAGPNAESSPPDDVVDTSTAKARTPVRLQAQHFCLP